MPGGIALKLHKERVKASGSNLLRTVIVCIPSITFSFGRAGDSAVVVPANWWSVLFFEVREHTIPAVV